MFNHTNKVQKDSESYQAILLKGKQSMIGSLSVCDNTRSNLIVDPISFKLMIHLYTVHPQPELTSTLSLWNNNDNDNGIGKI